MLLADVDVTPPRGAVEANVNIRIEIHIFSWHWMMKNMSFFNVSEYPFTDIKIPNFFHHSVQV